jgi:quercetin dioxygenase-like cupin family protein
MGENGNGGISVGPGDGEHIRNPFGGDLDFIVRAEQTNGALLAFETVPQPGEGPPLHVHTREEETIYVLSGDFRWKVGDELAAAPPGAFVFIPRGVSHTWQNVGEEPGKLLVTFMPAGMEGFFERLSRVEEFSLEEFRAAGAEHGMETVGPPLAESDPL